jgi:hypothetical protein
MLGIHRSFDQLGKAGDDFLGHPGCTGGGVGYIKWFAWTGLTG